jgi:uncharacterized protein YndB with AHSA1/START domain
MQVTEKVIEIDAPVERVFDLFSDFESFPRWMRNIKEVRYTGRRYTRWKADAPLGSSVEWEAETTHFEPDHRIAWRTVRGDVDTSGEVIFEETARGTTRLRVVLGYDPPAGRLGTLVASLFGHDPERQLAEDLERFAGVAEGRRGSRRAPYDGPGRREMRDGRGERGRGYDDHAEGFAGRDARDDFYARGPRRENDRNEGYRSRAYEEDDERHRERDERRRFDEALREARRSQLEGQRRYREERERDEQRRYDAQRERDERRARDERRFAVEDDERLRARDERRRERRMSEALNRRPEEDDDRRPRPYRHPMTPREWERERARGRQPDQEYSRQAFRRGVDKLMDEPPSGRWRRWD